MKIIDRAVMLYGKIKSKQHFEAFKNFCMSHKAAVKRMKKRGKR